MADDLLTPQQLGFDINTSDVLLYDGGTLKTISPGPSHDLNAIILAIDSEVTDINTTIAVLTERVSVSSSITTYDGTRIFASFTLVGTGLNEVFSEVATLVSANIANIAALDTTDIATGASTPLMNAAPYPAGPVVANSDEAFIAIDAAIKLFDTDKFDVADAIEIFDAALTSFIMSGTLPAIGSGPFDVDIAAIIFYRAGTVLLPGGKETAGPTTILVPASKDSYIDYDLIANAYVLISVANGAPEPAVALENVRVTKAVTDGVGIVSIVDGSDKDSIS